MNLDTTAEPTAPLTPERRAELLARAPSEAVVALAESCVDAHEPPAIVSGPEVGMVMMTVREPIASHRFHLGELLVTQAEVSLAGHRGWSMRMGEDRLGALAAAVLDAVANAHLPGADEVEELCHLAAEIVAAEDAAEWSELEPTQVNFDEID